MNNGALLDTRERWIERGLPWRRDQERPVTLADGIRLDIGRYGRLWLPSGHIVPPPARGGAGLFDNASSQFIAATSPVSAAPYTVACWGRCDESGNSIFRRAVSMGNTAATNSQVGLWFRRTIGGVAAIVWSSQGTTERVAATSTEWTPNQWHHACGREEASNARSAFIDGGSKGTNAQASTPTLSTLRIGVNAESSPAASEYFSGDLAEVAIYDDDLTDEEVALLAKGVSALMVRPANLVFYAPLVRDDDAGAWTDRIGGLSLSGTAPTVSDHPRVFYVPDVIGLPEFGGGLSTQTLSGSVTGAGALAKAVSATKTGSVTGAGSLTKLDAKPLTGSSTATGSLTTLRTIAQALAGSITATGALVKSTTKSLAGSVTGAGSLTKAVSQALTGSLTPAGALVRAISQALTGSVTATGALAMTRVVIQTLTGSITATGSLTKSVAQSLAGSVTPTGMLLKAATKALTASTTATGALTRAVSQTLSGASTATGAIAKAVTAAYTGSITGAGSLAKSATAVVGGTVTGAGSLTRAASKTLDGSVTAVGGVTKSITKTLSAAITAVGAIVNLFISGNAAQPTVIELAAAYTPTASLSARLSAAPSLDAAYTATLAMSARLNTSIAIAATYGASIALEAEVEQ